MPNTEWTWDINKDLPSLTQCLSDKQTSLDLHAPETHPRKNIAMISLTCNPSTLIVLPCALLALAYVTSTALQWYRLRKVPGPWLASVSSLWIVRVVARGQSTPFAKLREKYGPLVRVGPNLLLTDQPDILRRMSAARSSYGKDGEYGL